MYTSECVCVCYCCIKWTVYIYTWHTAQAQNSTARIVHNACKRAIWLIIRFANSVSSSPYHLWSSSYTYCVESVLGKSNVYVYGRNATRARSGSRTTFFLHKINIQNKTRRSKYNFFFFYSRKSTNIFEFWIFSERFTDDFCGIGFGWFYENLWFSREQYEAISFVFTSTIVRRRRGRIRSIRHRTTITTIFYHDSLTATSRSTYLAPN